MNHSPAPKVLCSTAPFFRQPLREAFRHIAGAGFEGVEVMVTRDPFTQEPHMLAQLASDHGLRVDAIHAPFLLVTRKVWGTDPVGKIYRAVHLAEEVGASIVVIHPPYRWQLRYQRWVQEQMSEFSSRTGVTVAIENMFPLRLRGDVGVSFHASPDLKDLDGAGAVVLDTSHAAVSGLDIREAIRLDHGVGRIRHVHLSNNAGKGWDSHLPVDQEGVLPLEEFLADIGQDGFRGNVALELDLRPWMQDERQLRDVLVRNREFCERRLAPVG